MTPSKENDKRFQAVKMVCSNWYDNQGRFTMMKVLLKDILANADIQGANGTIDLLNKLYARGVLTPDNYTILSDIISLTEEVSLQPEIKKQLPTFPDVKEGTISKNTRFSTHRQRLMKFGRNLSSASVVKIDKCVNKFPRNYADVWIMIADLENREIITEGEENLKKFVSLLAPAEIDDQIALKALTEAVGARQGNNAADTADGPGQRNNAEVAADGAGQGNMAADTADGAGQGNNAADTADGAGQGNNAADTAGGASQGDAADTAQVALLEAEDEADGPTSTTNLDGSG